MKFAIRDPHVEERRCHHKFEVLVRQVNLEWPLAATSGHWRPLEATSGYQ